MVSVPSRVTLLRSGAPSAMGQTWLYPSPAGMGRRAGFSSSLGLGATTAGAARSGVPCHFRLAIVPSGWVVISMETAPRSRRLSINAHQSRSGLIQGAASLPLPPHERPHTPFAHLPPHQAIGLGLGLSPLAQQLIVQRLSGALRRGWHAQ